MHLHALLDMLITLSAATSVSMVLHDGSEVRVVDLQPNDSTSWGTCCSDLDSRLHFCISECDSTLFACRSVPRQKGLGDVFATSQSDPLVSEPSERFSATHSAILSLVRMRKLLSTSLCHS